MRQKVSTRVRVKGTPCMQRLRLRNRQAACRKKSRKAWKNLKGCEGCWLEESSRSQDGISK